MKESLFLEKCIDLINSKSEAPWKNVCIKNCKFSLLTQIYEVITVKYIILCNICTICWTKIKTESI